MKDVLLKLNMVKNHNEIVNLKQKNKEINGKTQELVEHYKKIINEYERKNDSEIKRLKEKITKLEEENNNLKMQSQFYKDCLDKIPQFIIRIFVGKNKKLLNK